MKTVEAHQLDELSLVVTKVIAAEPGETRPFSLLLFHYYFSVKLLLDFSTIVRSLSIHQHYDEMIGATKPLLFGAADNDWAATILDIFSRYHSVFHFFLYIFSVFHFCPSPDYR